MSDRELRAITASTIIASVDDQDPAALVRFYEETYSREPAEAAIGAGWRALGAENRADHVIALCTRAGIRPASTLDVGCGDGALLVELRRRGFGGRRSGVEISPAAVDIAREREGIDAVECYDGEHLPAADGSYELGVLSHVLEHVPEPSPLFSEVARTCRAVVVEVPLEDNLSARRRGKREQAAAVGHLHRFSRTDVRELVTGAGLSVRAELDDPLPVEFHVYFASDTRGRSLGRAKWGLRAGVHRLAPGLARRLFTLHYACLCSRPGV